MPVSLPAPLTRTPLSADDAEQLLGRAREVQAIIENCRIGRFTVLTAQAGLGTSSLLRAGVVPALQAAGCITVLYSDWQGRAFPARFRAAILEAIHEQADGAFVPESDLRAMISRAQSHTGKPIVILLDQFEDYLQYHLGTDLSDEFDASLANVISSHVGCFVIGLHAESVTEFERLSQYVPNLMGYSIKLSPLAPDAARQLVRHSAAVAGVEIEDAAVDLLVSSPAVLVGSGTKNPGAHPLFVKLAAERLFDAEFVLKSKVARASTITANGGAERLIMESLDPVVNDLGSTHTELLVRWIPLLVTPDGRRTAASEKSLMAHAGKWNRFAATLLPLLVKKGLLRTLEMPAGTRYDFARESMATVIHDWWTRKEAAVVARQRALFRVGSISIAVGAILLAYLIYVYLTIKRP